MQAPGTDLARVRLDWTGKECRMNDSLREMIRRARRSGRSTDGAPGEASRNPLEQQAAEAVRLARVATAMHMSQVDGYTPPQLFGQHRHDVSEPHQRVTAHSAGALTLQWAEARS
jgi:hypothetical protein